MLTIGSLFAGVGGLELGLEWAGLGPVLWQVEIDPFARGVLAMHWPDATRFDDVTKVRGADLLSVDLLCGGFPCTDVSVAGHGAGLAGEQSGLWYEYARLVREIVPRFVVVENVAALVARGLDEVVGDLERAGYCVHGRIIAASDVGAPHRRERVFVVAYRDGERREGVAPRDREDGRVDVARRDDAAGCGANAPVVDAVCARQEGRVSERREGRAELATRRRDVAHADGDAVRHAEQRLPGRRAGDLRDGGSSVAGDDGARRGGGGSTHAG